MNKSNFSIITLLSLFTAIAISLPVNAEPAVLTKGKLTIAEGVVISDKGNAYFSGITLAQNDQGGLSITGAKAMPLVTVENVDVLILESFPLQVSLSVSGFLSVPCVELLSPATAYSAGLFNVVLAESVLGPAETCMAVTEPFETSVPLEVYGLPAGTYTVDVNGLQTEFIFDMDNAPFQ